MATATDGATNIIASTVSALVIALGIVISPRLRHMRPNEDAQTGDLLDTASPLTYVRDQRRLL
jgi:hypothetical protein